MKTVRKSVLVWYDAHEMFELVRDVARYPEFLPWCSLGRVIDEDADGMGMTAEVGIAFKGLKQSFVTYNTHVPDRELRIRLVKGPFSALNGVWTFKPVGPEGERACRVTLALDYGFDSKALALLVGPVFDKIAATMVDAFIQRAEQVYGAPRG